MKPSKLGGLFFLLSYLLLFFGGLFFFLGEGLAAIIEPAFETLPIDQTMISTVGKAEVRVDLKITAMFRLMIQHRVLVGQFGLITQ